MLAKISRQTHLISEYTTKKREPANLMFIPRLEFSSALFLDYVVILLFIYSRASVLFFECYFIFYKKQPDIYREKTLKNVGCSSGGPKSESLYHLVALYLLNQVNISHPWTAIWQYKTMVMIQ